MDQELIDNAKQAAQKAYAPYSNFSVGAAIRTTAGNVYLGCNVENAAYPAGVCAEKSAISAAIMGDGPKMKISAIAVYAVDGNGKVAVAAPCGQCRQNIHEFSATAQVYFPKANGYHSCTLDELLPFAFVLEK